MTTILKKLFCVRCGHSWFPRVQSPKKCPRCQRFDWMKSETGDSNA